MEAARTALERMQGFDYTLGLFWGKVGGVIGETSVALLLIGAIYLLVKGYIDWRIPAGYIGTVALLAWVFARVLRPEKIFLRRVPGRRNDLSVLHLLGLYLAYFFAQVLAQTALRGGWWWRR